MELPEQVLAQNFSGTLAIRHAGPVVPKGKNKVIVSSGAQRSGRC